MTRLERLSKKLNRLRKLDAHFQIFGAEIHRYISEPMSLADIQFLEDRHGAPLPIDLRTWLLEIGCRAGPYYGLIPTGPSTLTGWGVNDELKRSLHPNGYDEDGSWGDIEDLSKFSQSHIELYLNRLKYVKLPVEAYVSARTGRGGLVLCHHGCAGWSRIVLSGPYTGRIVDEYDEPPEGTNTAYAPAGVKRYVPLFAGDSLSWKIVHDPTGLFDFYGFLEDWLDRGIAYASVGFRR